MEQEYLTVKEAADFLKLSVGYVRKLMAWKKIHYYKKNLGNRCYFKRSELVAMIEATKSHTADELQAQAIAYTMKKNK